MLTPGHLYKARYEAWKFSNLRDAKAFQRRCLIHTPNFLGPPTISDTFFLIGFEHRILKILQGESIWYLVVNPDHSLILSFQRLSGSEPSEFIKQVACKILDGKLSPPRLRKRDG